MESNKWKHIVETQCKQKRRELSIYFFSNMNTADIARTKEAERHRNLRLKKKNEVTKLKCLYKFLSDKHKPTSPSLKAGTMRKTNVRDA